MIIEHRTCSVETIVWVWRGFFIIRFSRGANDDTAGGVKIVTQGGARFTSLALGYLLSLFQG
jgi:hypothetical protein